MHFMWCPTSFVSGKLSKHWKVIQHAIMSLLTPKEHIYTQSITLHINVLTLFPTTLVSSFFLRPKAWQLMIFLDKDSSSWWPHNYTNWNLQCPSNWQATEWLQHFSHNTYMKNLSKSSKCIAIKAQYLFFPYQHYESMSSLPSLGKHASMTGALCWK
jgi:hypothetical protein